MSHVMSHIHYVISRPCRRFLVSASFLGRRRLRFVVGGLELDLPVRVPPIAAAAVLGGVGVGGGSSRRRRRLAFGHGPAGDVGSHPANEVVVEGLVVHTAQAIESSIVLLVQEAVDAGVACLGVRDGGEHRRQVRDELLGVEVLRLNLGKTTRCSYRRVLLREVVKDGGGIVARELHGREVLELVEPLQAVKEKLVEHPVACDHGEEGQTLVVALADAVGGSTDAEVEQAACTRRMLGCARSATSSMKHLTLQRRKFLLIRIVAVVERGGNVAGVPIALVKDPSSVIRWKRNLAQGNHRRVVAFNGPNISTNHFTIPKDRFSIRHAKRFQFDGIDLGVRCVFEKKEAERSKHVTMLRVRMEM